jgi:anti-sigma factor RsiW
MTEFSCPEARSLVSDYIDGDLDADQALSLEQHLETCPHCPPLYASLVETLAELKALDDVSGVDRLVQRVLAALTEPPAPDDPLGPGV